MWLCPTCGENVEAEFDICWNCGTSATGKCDPLFKPADDFSTEETAGLPAADASTWRVQSAPATPSTKKLRLDRRAMVHLLLFAGVVGAITFYIRMPKNWQDYRQRAGRRSNHLGAISDYTRAIDLALEENVPLGTIHAMIYLRGRSYFDAGQYQNSVDDFSSVRVFALAHGSETLATSISLERGAAYLKLGDYEAAEADLQFYLSVRPGDTYGKRLLEEARRHLRNSPLIYYDHTPSLPDLRPPFHRFEV